MVYNLMAQTCNANVWVSQLLGIPALINVFINGEPGLVSLPWTHDSGIEVDVLFKLIGWDQLISSFKFKYFMV